MMWTTFGVGPDGTCDPIDRWADATHVLVTNRPPHPGHPSGFVSRYRSVLGELSRRGVAALVVVLDRPPELGVRALVEVLAAANPGVRYVVVAVRFAEPIPAGRRSAALRDALQSIRNRGLGTFPGNGPSDQAVLIVAHLHLAPLALAAKTHHGAFLLEEGFGRNTASASKGPAGQAQRVAQRLRSERLMRQVGDDGRPVVVLTDEERRHFSDWIPSDRIHVVALSIEVPVPVTSSVAPSRRTRGEDFVIGCVGRLSDERTFVPLRQIIEATIVHRSMRWVLVGAAPDQSLVDLSNRYPDRVTVTGWVPTVDQYYLDLDAVVVPAVSTTGSKTTLLQAWAAGVPCVASAPSARSVAAIHLTDVMTYSSAVGAAGALNSLRQDAELCQRLVEGGLRRIGELDGGALARQIVELAEAGRRLR